MATILNPLPQEYQISDLTRLPQDPAAFASEQQQARVIERQRQMDDWEAMVRDEAGFDEVANRRGINRGYQDAKGLIPGDELRKKLTRDLFISDVTGASDDELQSGVAQAKAAQMFGLENADDLAIDGLIGMQVQKQKRYRDVSQKVYDIAQKAAIQGTPWLDARNEATKLAGSDWFDFEKQFNQGFSDIYATLSNQDVSDVNQFWNLAGNVEGAETQSTTAGDLQKAFVNYERKTPQERDKIIQGIAMRAQAEGQDVDGALNRVGQALRMGTIGIASGLSSASGRIESDALKTIIEKGEVPAKFKDEITKENVGDLAAGMAQGEVLPTVGNFGIEGPKAETRPITLKEQKVIQERQEFERGAARFMQDLRSSGVKAKQYIRQNTQGGWFFGGSLEDSIVGFAESVPSMLTTAVPVVGPTMMATSYAEQERARLEHDFPGMSEDAVAMQSAAVGAWMAGADIVQNKIITSKVPRLNATLMKLGKPGAVALFGGRALTTAVGETAQEVFQDSGAPIVQQIASALNQDIKGPDWDEWMRKEKEAMGDIFRVSMLMGIVGGAGSTISDYMNPSQLSEVLKDKRALALAGIPEADALSISETAQTNGPAAAQLLQAAMIETPVDQRRAISEAAATQQLLEDSDSTLRGAGIPEMVRNDDGSVIVKYNDGVTNDRLFDTPQEALADIDAMEQNSEIQLARSNRDMIDVLTQQYSKAGDLELETENKPKISLEQWAGGNAERIEIARQRVRIYLRQAQQDMGMSPDIDLGRYFILGSSRNEFADGVTRIVASLSEGANPLTVLEEGIEGVGKYLIESRGISQEKMQGWIRETESFTRQKILAENFAELPPEMQFQELIEGWSRIGVAHATGRINDSQLPVSVKAFFRAIKRVIAEILNLAAGVRQFSESGKMDPQMRYWLDFAAGFDADGELANQQQLADAEILSQIGESFSIQDAADLEYRIQHRPLTIEGGASRMDDLMPSFGEDIYGPNALQYFGSGDLREREVLRILKSARGNPDHEVTIYRGIPDGVTAEISPGDWVTLSRKYAEEYGSVISKKVKARDVTAWADALLENGYDPQPIEGEGGQTFAITPAQDAEYLAAVEAGDMDAAQKMVDDAAKGAGYNQKAFHGASSKFDSFKPSKEWGSTFFFTTDEVYAKKIADNKKGPVVAAYLSLQNPVVISDYRGLSSIEEAQSMYGHDGIQILNREGDVDTLVVYDPNQIKSADPVTYDVQGNVIPLSQRFNPEDNRITFAVASAADPISSALDRIRSNPEEFAKFANAAKVAVSDVNRRSSQRALNSNLRQRDFDQFRDIAKLEAIARALPGELRGILTSAFRKVAEMRTTEGRERYIASLLPKVEQAIENNLQKTLRKEIKKTLKKGSVKVSDARTRGGKIGGVAHAIFEEAQRAIKITDTPDQSALQQADQLADKLRDQMEGNVTDEQLEELDGRVAAIELFADYENADSSRLTEALDLLKGVYAQGRAERLAVLKARKEQRQQRVQTILKGLDREGPITDAQRNAAKRKFSKFWSRIDEGIIQAGASGGQKFRRIAENTDDAATKALVDDLEFAALEAELAEQDANESDNVALGQAMRAIFGAKTEYGVSSKLRELTTPEVAPVEKAEGKTSDQTIKVPMKYAEAIASGQATGFETKAGARVELTDSQIEQVRDQLDEMDPEDQDGVRSIEVTEAGQFGERTTIGEISQLEGLQLWLTMRQPDQFAKLEKIGYDQQTMDQLEAWLKPETKALGLWMVNRIGEEAFTIDQLHRSEKGVGLRLVENYFPVRNDVSGSDNTGLSIDGPVQHTGKSISSLKERVKNNAPPAYVNAVAVFLANRAQTNFWKSHVSFLREWGGVLRDERVAAGIKNRMGETYYRSLMTTMKRIEGGGALNAAGLMDWEKVVRKMTSNFALATLGGRLSTLLINTTAGLNGILEIPAGQLAAGIGDLAQRPEAFKDAFNSPAMQRRFKTGGTYEAQLARAPGRSLNPVVAQLSAAAQVPVSAITKVDTGSQIIGAAIAWEYTRKQSLASGMDEQAARAEADKKVERIFLRAAQPTTRLAKSELELRAAENPLAALFTLFTSEPRKNLAIAYLAARELITGKGNYGRAMAAQQLFTVMLVQTTAAYLIRSAYASLAGAKDEEDEEFTERFSKRLDPKAMTYSLLTEHLKAVPIAGEIYNKAMAGAFDQPSFDSSQNPLNRVTQKGWKFAEKMFTDDKPATVEETIDGGIDAVQSLGTILPGGQVFAQSANLAEAVEGIISSNFQETLSDEDRIRRIKARFSKFSKEYSEEHGKVSGEDGKIDKEKQKARNAVLADQLKIELLPLTPELQRETLDALDVSDAVIKAAGFKVEK